MHVATMGVIDLFFHQKSFLTQKLEGSNEYYKALYHHDSALHGRKLTNYLSHTFLKGNKTEKNAQLGQ